MGVKRLETKLEAYPAKWPFLGKKFPGVEFPQTFLVYYRTKNKRYNEIINPTRKDPNNESDQEDRRQDQEPPRTTQVRVRNDRSQHFADQDKRKRNEVVRQVPGFEGHQSPRILEPGNVQRVECLKTLGP